MKFRLYLVAVALLCTCSLKLKAQIIFTIAGDNSLGYGDTGDGGPAVAAQLNSPSAVAIDQSGNLLIADMNNNVIREVDPSGFITTYAGSGTIGYEGDGFYALAARLNYPTGVAADQAGNVYIADQFNHVVRQVNNTTNIINTFAGNGYEASAGPGGYSGDNGPATAAEFYSPSGIAFDNTGNLYITDIGNSVIRKVNTVGLITTIAGMSLDTGYSGDKSAATAAKLNSPMGIAVDASGNIYFADNYNNVIRKINTTGIISTVAGNGFHNGSADHSGAYKGDGGQATNAELSLPTGVAIDASGDLFIADQYNQVIREVNTSGIITTVAGNGNAGFSGEWGAAKSAELNFPQGITINGSGDLIIADLNNNVVRKVNIGTVGVNQLTLTRSSVQLILNPNKGVFTVKGTMGPNTDQNVSLEVMDMQGQVVYKNTLASQNGDINTEVSLDSELPNGVYILRVNTGNEASVSRFVLEK